ncbi:MAG: hypothetical protein JWO38_8254 [Gemmataceae bacterium]|nr:hypothetical protein [Gemmataceae bacterium]
MDVHPLAERYPLMGEEEFGAFKADIQTKGLKNPISTFEGKILDGRNRYRACRELQKEPVFAEFTGTPEEASAFVDSQNLRRRHLTQDQIRCIVAEMVKRKPERSNRDIAACANVSDKTVGAVRARLEATAEIPQLTKTTGRDGKARPARVRRSRMTAVNTYPGSKLLDANNSRQPSLFDLADETVSELVEAVDEAADDSAPTGPEEENSSPPHGAVVSSQPEESPRVKSSVQAKVTSTRTRRRRWPEVRMHVSTAEDLLADLKRQAKSLRSETSRDAMLQIGNRYCELGKLIKDTASSD